MAAGRFFELLLDVDRIFEQHRATLSRDVSPINFWTHGFDLAFEWYGTRMVEYAEGDEVVSAPSQLNLGFFPASPAYFYSNPWPFEADQLLDKPLPEGAAWHTDGWEGSIFPYAELIDDDGLTDDEDAEARILAFAQSVYDISAPTLSG